MQNSDFPEKRFFSQAIRSYNPHSAIRIPQSISTQRSQLQLRDHFRFLWFRINLVFQLDVAVVLQSGSSRNQTSHNDVFFQTTQIIDFAADGCFGKHPRGLLEGCRGNERIGAQRRLGNSQQQRTPHGRLAAFRLHTFVLFQKLELVYLFLKQELRVANFFNFDPAHHLADDHLNMLIVDVDALEPIDLLDFVDQVSLQFLFSQDPQDVVRITRAVHQSFTGVDILAFLNIDVNAPRQQVFRGSCIFVFNDDFALPAHQAAIVNHAVNFSDDSRFFRLTRFKQLHDARQTAGNVLGLCGFARDFGQRVAWMNFVAAVYHQVRLGRHQISLNDLPFGILHLDLRLPFFVRRLSDDLPRQSCNFVDFLLHGDAFEDVLEDDGSTEFR